MIKISPSFIYENASLSRVNVRWKLYGRARR